MEVRVRRTQSERRAETRERLLDAAEQLFTERGFHATSLDAVALAAGYSKGAVYGHFDSKDDLFLAVYERRVSARAEEVTAGTSSMSWEDAVSTVMNRYHDMLRRRPLWRAVVIEFAAHAVRDPELRRRYAAAHKQVNAHLREALPPLPTGTEAEDAPGVMAILASGTSLETLIDPTSLPRGLPGRMALNWLKGN